MKHNNAGRRFLRALITAIALSFAWVGGAAAVAIEPFALPGALSPRDGGSSGAVPIGFPINFFGVTHTQLFVNNDGSVTFAPLTPRPLEGLVGFRQPIIAPFSADVDTRAAGSGVVRFGTPPGRPDLFVVNWIAVGYFNQHDDRLNSFQLILQDLSAVPGFAPGDFRIVFNYDRILWETGDANSGINGLGGKSARVGFSDGSGQPGTFFELPGSASSGSFPDGGRHSLVGNSLPPGDESLPLGRYQFVVRNGAIAQADLAIAADADRDKRGFEFVVRNFGRSATTGVKVAIEVQRGRITAIRPRRLCRREAGNKTKGSCLFPVIQPERSRRIQIKTTSPRGNAVVTGLTFDSDPSNNSVRATRSCGGQILSQSAPESVLYEPTATVPARQTLQLKIINSGDKRLQIRGIIPLEDEPFLIDGVTPRLPRTIKSGGVRVFRVQTQRPVVTEPRLYPTQRPYFQIRFRCLD